MTRHNAILRLGVAGTLVLLAACGSPARSSSGPLAVGSGPADTAQSQIAGQAVASPAAASAEATTQPAASSAPVAQTQNCERSAKGGVQSHAQIVDVRVGSHDGVDRIVFEFANQAGPAGVPSYEIARAARPFYQDASGLPLTVAGDPVLSIRMQGATKAGPDYQVVYKGSRDFVPGFPILRQHKEGGDFEALSTWYAGLNGDACVRAYTLSNPLRLVIDLSRP
jgi:hypothetical protein